MLAKTSSILQLRITTLIEKIVTSIVCGRMTLKSAWLSHQRDARGDEVDMLRNLSWQMILACRDLRSSFYMLIVVVFRVQERFEPCDCAVELEPAFAL